MKWVFLLLLIFAVPVLTNWLRRNPGKAPRAWALMGFLPFVLAPWNLYVAPISWSMWPGYVPGMEVSALDAVALAVFLSRSRTPYGLPFKFALFAYLATVLLSVVQASVPMTAFFYAWQLGRVILLCAAVVRICDDERAPAALIWGMVVGLCLQAAYAALDYASGATQTGGTLGHQNLLGMASHFVAFPAVALLLLGGRGWAPVLGPISGLAVAIFTASRATIGFAGFGYLTIFALSGIRKWTSRKAAITMIALVTLTAATPLALNSLERRFSEKPLGEDEYDERAAFEEAAWMIIDDHPMGIGANHYVVVTNTEGYSEKAGVIWSPTSRSAHVHNVYLLVAAETGYLGLAAYVFLLICPIVVAFRGAWRNRRDKRGDLLLGLGVALIVMSVHSLYEWITITFVVQYMFAINIGLIGGISQQMKYQVRQQRGRSIEAAPLAPSVTAA